MANPTLELLLSRRSAKAAELTEPGPAPQQLTDILTAAARVPDHKAQFPWRFIVFKGDARARFGEILAEVVQVEEADPPSEMRLETERQRLMNAPVTVAVISRAKDKPGVPEWEQVLSVGAACQNLVIAATAAGFGVQWVTRWYSYSKGVAEKLGLAEGERIAGFIHIGSQKEAQADRKRPILSDVVSEF